MKREKKEHGETGVIAEPMLIISQYQNVGNVREAGRYLSWGTLEAE